MHIEGPQCKDLKNIVTLMTSTFLFKWENLSCSLCGNCKGSGQEWLIPSGKRFILFSFGEE